jgi:hypothetical protein
MNDSIQKRPCLLAHFSTSLGMSNPEVSMSVVFFKEESIAGLALKSQEWNVQGSKARIIYGFKTHVQQQVFTMAKSHRSIRSRMDKENLVRTRRGTVFSHKERRDSVI